MTDNAQAYNIAIIRELLTEAFTAEELYRLFLYSSNPDLRPLTDEFSSSDGLTEMVDRTIIYCEKRLLLPALLSEVEQTNPRQYARFEPELRISKPAPARPPPSAKTGKALVVPLPRAWPSWYWIAAGILLVLAVGIVVRLLLWSGLASAPETTYAPTNTPTATETPIPPTQQVEPGAEALQVASLGTWGAEGDGDGQFRRPWGIGAAYEKVYVADDFRSIVQVFNPRGEYLGRLPGKIIGNHLAVDSNGLVYAVNYDPGTGRNNWVEIFSYESQEMRETFDLVGPNPRGLAVDIYGENINVTDITDQNVRRYAPDGQVTAEWGREGNGDGEFRDPWGIAMDRYNTRRIYVADTGNDRMQVFSPDGEFLAKWGTQGTGDGQFDSPIDVAVDTSGNVYVLDRKNARVQLFSPAGEFLGKWGSVGRGEGEFLDPYGIAADLEDNVYVLDSGNLRVQVFRMASTP